MAKHFYSEDVCERMCGYGAGVIFEPYTITASETLVAVSSGLLQAVRLGEAVRGDVCYFSFGKLLVTGGDVSAGSWAGNHLGAGARRRVLAQSKRTVFPRRRRLGLALVIYLGPFCGLVRQRSFPRPPFGGCPASRRRVAGFVGLK